MILNSPIIIHVTNRIYDKTKLVSLHVSVDEAGDVSVHDLLPLLSFSLQFFVQLQINMRWWMLLVQWSLSAVLICK